MLKKRLFFIPLLFVAAVLLISWGSVGHTKISQSAGDSFNSEMDQFRTWVDFLAEHSSDADYRKSSDPEESPKHFIDIDNYAEFKAKGRIPQTLDSVVALYGIGFVKEAGILPWATLRTVDTLTNCMKRGDWTKARITAADLGHYVGDGHMPLHITSNYNGQQTGNDGIHSRYESTMIGGYVTQIVYPGQEPELITDMNNFVFGYLYENNRLVDSVLNADYYAKSFSSNTSSSTYKQALWNKSKSFTVPLFQKASHRLASMIYTAWVNAGKPLMTVSGIEDEPALSNAALEAVSPNPFWGTTTIRFNLKEKLPVILQVRDMQGSLVGTLVHDTLQPGQYQVLWDPAIHPAGMYIVVLNAGNHILIEKILYRGN